MTEDLVLTKIDARGVATVTLNRPDVHNALNDVVIAGLHDAFEAIAANGDIRAMILTGAGKSFSAGADLKRMRETAAFSPAETRADALAAAAMFERLNTMPMPTIARVQGAAFAGALGLVCACDLAVGAAHAVFAVSEVRLGIVAAVISPYVIAAIGPGPARRYFQTAERIDAAEAQRIGLLHETAPAEMLDDVVEGIVGNILKNAPASVAACKTLIRETAGPVTDVLRETVAATAAATRATDEAREGIASFFEKRKPSWALGGRRAS